MKLAQKLSFLAVLALAARAEAAEPQAAKAKAAKNPVVLIKTSHGTMKAEIFADKAPATAENFLRYVDEKFYDGTIFHRVIPDFMIQGGGFDKAMTQKKTRDPVKNEAQNGLSNDVGTLAMARTMDPNSATSQFFVNVVHNQRLDYNPSMPGPGGAGYTVFGKLLAGIDVAKKISALPTTDAGGMQNVPAKTVLIESIRRAK